ncbi:MAG: hypothetical protein KDI36_04160 [Pseudomonadales bacterium]|nr:hypothetical protein [Pseudomonadales bacterium]
MFYEDDQPFTLPQEKNSRLADLLLTAALYTEVAEIHRYEKPRAGWDILDKSEMVQKNE